MLLLETVCLILMSVRRKVLCDDSMTTKIPHPCSAKRGAPIFAKTTGARRGSMGLASGLSPWREGAGIDPRGTIWRPPPHYCSTKRM